MVHWLRLWPFHYLEGGKFNPLPGSIPGGGTKTPHAAALPGQKKKKGNAKEYIPRSTVSDRSRMST